MAHILAYTPYRMSTDDSDYVTLLKTPQHCYQVVVMGWDKQADGYVVKDCSGPIQGRPKARLQAMWWALDRRLEMRL